MKLTKEQFDAVQRNVFALLGWAAKGHTTTPTVTNGLCYALSNWAGATGPGVEDAYGYKVMELLLTDAEYCDGLGASGDLNEDRINFLLFMSILTWADFNEYFNMDLDE